MKKMNIKLKIAAPLFVFIMLLIGNAVNAQSGDTLARLKNGTPEERARIQNEMMKSKLALNDTQYKQVADINLKYAQKIAPIMKSDDSKFSKYRQIKPIMEEKDEDLKAILTKGQFEKYTEIKKEMMAKARDYKDGQ
jgi:hypothetical protein